MDTDTSERTMTGQFYLPNMTLDKVRLFTGNKVMGNSAPAHRIWAVQNAVGTEEDRRSFFTIQR